MKAPKKNLTAAALLVAPVFASALGLGGINVKSGLNQPLEAEIPVTVNSAAERESLSVMLANADDYARVGIDASRLSVPIEFAVAKDSRGETVIRVTTKDAIREPFLQLLLQVNWSSGKLLREYSLLIDPPVMAPALRGSQVMSRPIREPAPVMASEPMAVAKPAAEARSEPKPVAAPVIARPMAEARPIVEARPIEESRPTPEFKPVAEAKPTAEPGSVTTKGGDSLYVIANANKPSASTNLDQMMVAILRMNPQAFYQDNVNALKKGQILRMPGSADVNKISIAQASKAVAEQNSLWRSYQAASAQQSAVVADPGVSTSASNAYSTPNNGARLELVPPKSGDNGKALGAATAETSRVREELVSREREASDLRARVTELEKLAADNERVVTLKNQELAQITKQLEDARKTAAALAAAAAKAPVAVTPPVENTRVETAPLETTPVETAPIDTAATETVAVGADPTKPDPTKTDPTVNDPTATDPTATDPTNAAATESANTDAGDIWGDTPTDGSTETTATPDMASGEVEPDPNAIPADGTTVTPIDAPPVAATEETSEDAVSTATAEPVAEDKPWYMNPITWGIAGAGILGAFALLLGRKKKPARFISTPAFGDAEVNFGIPTIAAATAADFVVHDEDEARIRSAISADPQDLWAHLDLLRLYYSRQDRVNFEDAASTMFGFVLDQEAPQWQEARTMGLQLVPGSSLFPVNSAPLDSPSDNAFDTGSAFDSVPSYSNANEFDSTPAFHDEPLGSLDLGAFDDVNTRNADLGATVVAKPFTDDAPSDFSFDLDLDSPTKVIEPIKSNEALVMASPRAEDAQVEAPKDDFNFDFSFDAPAKAPELDIPSKAAPAFNVGDISLGDVIPAPLDNLGDMGADDFMIGDDSVGTKLDLARAYLDMGDPDGARSMLEEVLGEGSDMQRNEAKELLQRIA